MQLRSSSKIAIAPISPFKRSPFVWFRKTQDDVNDNLCFNWYWEMKFQHRIDSNLYHNWQFLPKLVSYGLNELKIQNHLWLQWTILSHRLFWYLPCRQEWLETLKMLFSEIKRFEPFNFHQNLRISQNYLNLTWFLMEMIRVRSDSCGI